MELNDLPLELFRSFVFPHLSKEELSLLSKTSKQMRAAVEPDLYREIRWEWRKDVRKHPPIHLLARTILSRPSLALCIEKLDLRGQKPRTAWEVCRYRRNSMLPMGPSISIWEAEEKPSFTTAEMTAAEQFILSLHLQSKRLWLQELKRGEVDIFIAILLSYLSSLQSLNFESDFQRDTIFAGEVMSSNIGAKPDHGFPALQSVSYSNDVVQDVDVAYHVVDLNQILPLLCFESIQSLKMSLPPLAIAWPEYQVPKSSLTSLILSHTQLSEENLGHLLMATPQLRSLVYHSHFDIDSGGRPGRNHWEYYDCKKLDSSLAHVKNTLERLVLSVRFSSLQSDVALGGFRGMADRVKSLQHFEKLKALEIPFIMLLGWEFDAQITIADLLPANLYEICFTDDLDELAESEWTDEGLLSLVENYLEQRDRRDFKIESVSLKLNVTQTSWCEEQRTRLKRLCDDAQITCTVFKKNPDLLNVRRAHSTLLHTNRGGRSSRGVARGR